jgi:TonB family protein
MTPMIDLALRVAAVTAAALIARWLLRRRSAAVRHAALTAGVAASIALPLIALLLPRWHVDLRPAPALEIESSGDAALPPARPAPDLEPPGPPRPPAAGTQDPFPLEQIIAGGWALGSLAGVCGLAAGLVRLRRIALRARPAGGARLFGVAASSAAELGVSRQVTLLVSETEDLPATWGARRPRILLPADAPHWADDRLRVVLCHELAHVQRGDWPIQIIAELLRSLFWFNPLLWLLCAWLRHDSEQACDDVVMAAGVPAADYAGHLLEIARASRSSRIWAPVMPVARPSTLKRRIVAMLKTDLDRRPLTMRHLMFACAALLAVAAPIGVVSGAGQAGPATLAGVVYDPTGAVLPGVTLTLEDAQQVARTTTTDSAGRYAFGGIAAGTYVLQSTLAGFHTLRQAFTLAAIRDWTQVVTMQVGTLQETITIVEQRPASTQAPTTPAAARIGGNIKTPKKLVDVKPVYPPAMRDAGLEGTVPIEARIGTDGSVVSAQVASARVHPEFAAAAIDAVRQWQFSPTLLNGTAIEVLMTVRVQFRLEE